MLLLWKLWEGVRAECFAQRSCWEAHNKKDGVLKMVAVFVPPRPKSRACLFAYSKPESGQRNCTHGHQVSAECY